jgi:hypothetical protein
MRLFLRAGHALLCSAVIGVASPACYTAGEGTPPPMTSFYFPTGLAVSSGGNVLYAINSDFDLQWNGGTLQTYDLFKLRRDTASLIQANLTGANAPPPGIPFLTPWVPNCLAAPPPDQGNSFGVQLSQGCAPAVDSTQYVHDSAIVGAFATDLQVSQLQISDGSVAPNAYRLLSPVAGSATVTWADVVPDDPNIPPPEGANAPPYPPFSFNCGVRVSSRCDGEHATGDNANQNGNTRNETMPGEPFGMAQSQDGTVLAVTSETDVKTSLLTTATTYGVGNSGVGYNDPIMEFVLQGLPVGGVAIAAVPHDSNSVDRCELSGDVGPCIRPAFLETYRYTSEVDLLRYYDDDNTCTSAACGAVPVPGGSSLYRPFLVKERAYQINTNLGGSDFRGIAIDPTPRLKCELLHQASPIECGQIPARVFIASRTPPSLVIGQIGLTNDLESDTYDPDAFTVTGNIPLPAGPSKVYLAPVVMPDYPGAGTSHYELRVFVVLFDSSGIEVIDPDAVPPLTLSQNVFIPVGPGPYALAFDPFDWNDVAVQNPVPVDPRQPPELALGRYRFAYVASFTQSYAQVIDLDALATQYETFEKVVFNFGPPSYPKGQTP